MGIDTSERNECDKVVKIREEKPLAENRPKLAEAETRTDKK